MCFLLHYFIILFILEYLCKLRFWAFMNNFLFKLCFCFVCVLFKCLVLSFGTRQNCCFVYVVILFQFKWGLHTSKNIELTNPCLSEMLLVNFNLWKDTDFCIHCSPVLGESGWMYIRLGISGSAFPATIQRLLWNLYLQSSTATMSINKIYLDLLSSPDTFTLNGGNILLE